MSRSIGIDILRIIGLVLVIVYHLISVYAPRSQISFGIPGIYYLNIGEWGVSIFLFISGFVLMQKYAGRLNVREFYTRRIKRLYITYFICLGIVILLPGRLQFLSDAPHIFCTATATCAFFGLTRSALLGSGWFIGAIAAQYLLFPLYRWLLKKDAYAFLFLITTIAFLFRFEEVYFNSLIRYFINWFPLTRMFEFGAGMVFGQLMLGMKPLVSLPERWARNITYIGLWTFPMYLLHLDFIPDKNILLAPLGLIAAGILSVGVLEVDKLLTKGNKDIHGRG